MGEVYEAWDRDLGERVALKAIRPDVAAGPGALAAFQREIGMARTVASPHVGRIFDLYHHWELGDTETIHFVTMELLRGVNLRERLEEESRLPWRTALPLLRHIASALEATAAVGIVHRDLKPDNVMLVGEGKESRAVVMDFGLAFFAQPKEEWVGHASPWSFGRRRLSSRAACGTPGYISPEQLRGEAVDHRADFFSFGVLAYETLSGSAPFEAEVGAALTSRFDRPPARLRALEPSVPSELEQIVHRCLSIEPEARFQTAAELSGALEAACPRTPTRRKVLLGGALAAAGALFFVEHGASIAGFISGLAPRVLPLDELARSPEALSALREGFSLLAAGENLASIAEFERALASEPELALAHVERIHALLNAGEDDRAFDLLSQFDAAFAGVALHPYVQKHLATMRSRAALKYHDAVEHERRLLEEFPDDLHVRLSHARRVEEAGLLREAVELYEPISAESAAALLGMGRALVFSDESKRVVDTLETASALGHLPNTAEARGMLHSILGRAHRDMGNLRNSARHYEKSLDWRRRARDRRGESGTLTNFAQVYMQLARFDEARRMLERALDLARASGDRTHQSFALLNLGRVLMRQGRPAEALPYFSESTAIEMDRREEYEMATRLVHLANVYARLTRHEESLLFLEQSVPCAKRSRSPALVAHGRWVQSRIALARGDYDSAERFASRARDLYEANDWVPDVVDARLMVVRADEARGRFASALEGVSRSVGELEHLEDVLVRISAQVLLAELMASLGDWPGAESALDKLDEKTCFDAASRVLLVRGTIERARENWPAARDVFEAAIAEAKAAGYRDLEIRGRVEMGRTLAALGEYESAKDILNEQVEAAKSAGLVPIELEARIARSGLRSSLGEFSQAGGEAREAVRLAEARPGTPPPASRPVGAGCGPPRFG